MSALTREQTAARLREWDDVLILTHKSPDGDTVGSAAALCRLLRRLGKTAWMLESLDITDLYRPYLEGLTAPADFAPRRVISVDVAGTELLPPNAQPYLGRIDLAIDHHGSHTPFAAEWLVEGDKAACGEVVFALAERLGVMDEKIAEALYVAVTTDTGCFVYGNTTPNTHRVAAALMEQGICAPALNKRHFRTKTLKRMKLESALLRDMELYENGAVAVAPVSLELLAQLGATEEDTDDIASFAGQIEGVLHAVTVKEKEPGLCRISLRTQADRLNASAVCARLGGGGHPGAAGCTVHGTVRQAIDAMVAAIRAEQKG